MSWLFKWLTEKAKFPRFVWVVLALGIFIVAGALGYRILTASSVMVNATEHLSIAVQAQKEALQHREEACEVLQAMSIHFSKAQMAMNKRFDELINKMEKAKERFKRPAVTPFSTSGSREKIIRDISTMQTALREDRESFKIPNFKDLKGGMAKK